MILTQAQRVSKPPALEVIEIMVNRSLNESYLKIKIQHFVWLSVDALTVDKYTLSEVIDFRARVGQNRSKASC